MRTLWFLLLAMAGLLLAIVQGFHTTGTVLAVAVGLVGAAGCSAMGWRTMFRADWVQRSRTPRPRD